MKVIHIFCWTESNSDLWIHVIASVGGSLTQSAGWKSEQSWTSIYILSEPIDKKKKKKTLTHRAFDYEHSQTDNNCLKSNSRNMKVPTFLPVTIELHFHTAVHYFLWEKKKMLGKLYFPQVKWLSLRDYCEILPPQKLCISIPQWRRTKGDEPSTQLL